LFGLHSLPPITERVIAQTWRLTEPPIDGTRSIEYVGEQAFIVARHTDPEGKKLGGDDGHLLERRKEGEWVSTWNGIVWLVQPNGDLAAYKDNELVFAGAPCEGLWG
jgi:hypothetical protein